MKEEQKNLPKATPEIVKEYDELQQKLKGLDPSWTDKDIINCSIALYNKILPFVQFLISYDILFRIYLNSNKFMDYNNFHKYSFMIAELLNKIDVIISK